MPIATINPATGETVRTYEAHTPVEMDDRLARAARTFKSYRRTSFDERAGWMTRLAEIVEAEREELGRLMTTEMGKPLRAAVDEAAKCARACRHYAEHAAAYLRDEDVETDAERSFLRHEPLGCVLAVMPWNFPFWQVFRFLAPALMAGNVGVLKHASNVPGCGVKIEQLVRAAGFPADVFQTLLVTSSQVARIIEDPRIAAVTLTGSEAAGADVASRAGREIKKTVLELGGSDPFIVMPSADLEKAVETGVRARTINNGQSCIAAKRFIIHTGIYDDFARRFVERMQRLKVGDPLDPATEIGPLATPDILRDLDDQVRRTTDAGARLLTGGHALEGTGNFYPPTVLADIPEDSPADREELFGPVASLFRARDIDDAIRIANRTVFGLGSSAWTTDAGERDRFISELDAGQVFINAMVASDPRIAFGGVKRSGYGRELGRDGIREFVNIKTVWIESGKSRDANTDTTE